MDSQCHGHAADDETFPMAVQKKIHTRPKALLSFEMEKKDMMQVLESLQYWKNTQPDKKAWIFLNDKGDPSDEYTYAVGSNH